MEFDGDDSGDIGKKTNRNCSHSHQHLAWHLAEIIGWEKWRRKGRLTMDVLHRVLARTILKSGMTGGEATDYLQ